MKIQRFNKILFHPKFHEYFPGSSFTVTKAVSQLAKEGAGDRVIVFEPEFKTKEASVDFVNLQYCFQQFNIVEFTGNMIIKARNKAKTLTEGLKALSDELPYTHQVTASPREQDITNAAQNLIQRLND